MAVAGEHGSCGAGRAWAGGGGAWPCEGAAGPAAAAR